MKNETLVLILKSVKASDCSHHKLNAYRFIVSTLRLEESDLFKLKLFVGVLQGSILGLYLFNTFTRDLFTTLEETNLANYADDNIVFYLKKHHYKVPWTNLKLFEWFSRNQM